uniref:ITPR-interacting domain-containing protein n=1 Tax=Esox lucius TaxID=8010 RepID=A0AAY5KNJ4_ESOLU
MTGYPISPTDSVVSEVLQLCAEDAEETLCQLGFGLDEPAVTARIPTRFLNFPSQLNGINFRLFLQSQLNRLRQEDPGLSLASKTPTHTHTRKHSFTLSF